MITAETKMKTLQTTKETKSYTYYHCTHKKDSQIFRCNQRKHISGLEFEKQISEILSSIDIAPEFFGWAK